KLLLRLILHWLIWSESVHVAHVLWHCSACHRTKSRVWIIFVGHSVHPSSQSSVCYLLFCLSPAFHLFLQFPYTACRFLQQHFLDNRTLRAFLSYSFIFISHIF